MPDHLVGEAIASGEYAPVDDSQRVTMIDEASGATVDVDAGSIETHARMGDQFETAEGFRDREDQARKERERSGLYEGIVTGVENFVDAGTLGLGGLLMDEIGGDEYANRRRERTEIRGGIATGAGLASVLLPSGLAGSAGRVGKLARSTPIGRITSAAERAASGRGVLGKAAVYGAEGAVLGAGEGLQAATISEDPLTLERAVGSMGMGALYGAGLGGGVSLAGSALSKGLQRGKSALGRLGERGGKVSDDLGRMDADALKGLKRERAEVLGREVVEDVKGLVGRSEAFRAVSGKENAFIGKANRSLDDLVSKNAKFTAERPSGLLKPLYQQEEVLQRALAGREALIREAAERESRLIKQLDDDIASYTKPKAFKKEEGALYGDLFDKRVTKKGVKLDKAGMEEFRAMLQSGRSQAMRREALDALPDMLEQNLAAQAKVKGILNGTAEPLAEVGAALDALKGGKPKGLLDDALAGGAFTAATGAAAVVLPDEASFLSPLLGAAAAGKMRGLMSARLGKVAQDASIRSSKALDAFFGAASKAKPAAIPLASKVLGATTLRDQSDKSEPKSLASAYQERAKEIRNLVQQTPEGPKLRMDKREEIAGRLSALRAASPLAADQMEATAARQVEFLAAKLPRRPDIGIMKLGPDTWQPSSMAMRQFARYVAAVNDPGAVEERLADGTVTPEDAEALRTVYPSMYEDIKLRILQRLPELRESLPYKRRLALSIFSGVPVDEAMSPPILAVLQGQFAEEPGTEGGTVAPTAQPQFGSVSREQPTPAQDRAGG